MRPALIELSSGMVFSITDHRRSLAQSYYNDSLWAHAKEKLTMEHDFSASSDTWDELRKYLCVKAAFHDVGHGGLEDDILFAPVNASMDSAWHDMLLASTSLYSMVCKMIFGEFIHHSRVSVLKKTHQQTQLRAIRNSRKAIEYCFGNMPNSVWTGRNADDDHDGRCEAEPEPKRRRVSAVTSSAGERDDDHDAQFSSSGQAPDVLYG